MNAPDWKAMALLSHSECKESRSAPLPSPAVEQLVLHCSVFGFGSLSVSLIAPETGTDLVVPGAEVLFRQQPSQ